MAIRAVGLIAEPVVHRGPEILVDQQAAAAFVTDFTLLCFRAAGVAGVAVVASEADRVRVRMVVEYIPAVAGGAGDAVDRAARVAVVAMGVDDVRLVRVGMGFEAALVANGT